MFSLKGDAHKIFLRVKQLVNKGESIKQTKEFSEIEGILKLYQSLDSSSLKLIYYRMVKEKNGAGIIPIFVTTIPWLLFLFSKQLTDFLFREGRSHWIIFALIYLVILSFSVILHFRERAWAAFHMEMIQDILKERNTSKSGTN